MPELKISRAYHEALRRIGVQNPGEVGVQVPVQLVAAVDDFTHLAPPISVSVCSFSGRGVGVLAEHAGIEVIAGARTRGIWIDGVEENSNGGAVCFINAAILTIDAVIVPVCFSGPAPVSILRSITTGVPPGNGALEISANDRVPLRFFLAPGDSFQIVRAIANTNGDYTIHFREVPVVGDVEP